ncbi:hypothetical protein CDAR_558471 [Caerostris darwini]|uniref:Uncharacterized protein n=1 Tax=Caerostris darwini TaxID=1538125 RepID=A0AAV4S7J1_9ARAC|nr:hypothetical protein CDAR_558471 [Caerostris darwini]
MSIHILREKPCQRLVTSVRIGASPRVSMQLPSFLTIPFMQMSAGQDSPRDSFHDAFNDGGVKGLLAPLMNYEPIYCGEEGRLAFPFNWQQTSAAEGDYPGCSFSLTRPLRCPDG